MYNELEIIEGIFIKESRNRFLCEVLINGVVEECYVPSSSRIENYLALENKKVLLTRNTGRKVRTRYSLFAVRYYNKYILLNLNKVNEILSYYIGKVEYNDNQLYTIEKEVSINGYKSDLLIREITSSHITNKIIEAKGIIDIKNETNFPKVHSERALKQLNQISSLLEDNYIVEYYFVSLSPIVKKIIITPSTEDYYQLLTECLKKGLKVKGISVTLNSQKEVLFKKVHVVF